MKAFLDVLSNLSTSMGQASMHMPHPLQRPLSILLIPIRFLPTGQISKLPHLFPEGVKNFFTFGPEFIFLDWHVFRPYFHITFFLFEKDVFQPVYVVHFPVVLPDSSQPALFPLQGRAKKHFGAQDHVSGLVSRHEVVGVVSVKKRGLAVFYLFYLLKGFL